jgi:hypothetical protein
VTPERYRKKEQAKDRQRVKRDRERVERERRVATPMLYTTEDWQDFLDPATLARKAGCEPEQLPAMVLKELADNSADAGAKPALVRAEDGGWIATDDGPGLDPASVPKIFSVNRSRLSSKQKRMPTRGMLGNGLRVVMGLLRKLTVETRGVRLRLEVDEVTGETDFKSEDIGPTIGLTVIVHPSEDIWDQNYHHPDDWLARRTIAVSQSGGNYTGPSCPWWYGPTSTV